MPKSFCLALILFTPGAFGEPRWSLGAGYEARVQREVNPGYTETQGMPELFGRAQWTNWGGELEGSYEQRESSAGGLKITARSLSLGFWGRYAFLESKRWRPFAALGGGSYQDRVTSEFGALSDERRGYRPFVGTGGGIFAVFWDHFLIEAEGRVSFVRERKDPALGLLFRTGFLF